MRAKMSSISPTWELGWQNYWGATHTQQSHSDKEGPAEQFWLKDRWRVPTSSVTKLTWSFCYEYQIVTLREAHFCGNDGEAFTVGRIHAVEGPPEILSQTMVV